MRKVQEGYVYITRGMAAHFCNNVEAIQTLNPALAALTEQELLRCALRVGLNTLLANAKPASQVA